MKKLLLTIVVISFAFAAKAEAATYYVATVGGGGSDSNPGTIGSPFLTPQKAANIVNPGDTVYIRAGTYDGFSLQRSGTAGNVITFTNYPNESVTILGNFLLSSVHYGIFMSTFPSILGYITISGLNIGNAAIPVDGSGIVMGANQFITISHNNIYNVYDEPIYVAAGSNITIDHNILHDYGHPLPDRWHGHGIYATGHHYTISNNLIYNTGYFAIQAAAYTTTTVGCGFCANIPNGYGDLDDWNVINNTLVSLHAVGTMVVWDGSDPGLTSGNVSNIHIENNIFSSTSTSAIRFEKDGTSGGTFGPNIDVMNNLSTAATMVNNTAGASFTSSGNLTSTNPQFTASTTYDFTIPSSSPAKDAALSTSTVTDDLIGTARPYGPGPDIGAYEFFIAAVTNWFTSIYGNIKISGNVKIR